MSAVSISDNTAKYTHASTAQSMRSKPVCVLIGHSMEAITSAVVLASLGQRMDFYADLEILSQNLHQYGFEHHLQALWQIYEQQQIIVSQALPSSADTFIHCYETPNCGDSRHINESNEQ